MQSSGRKTNLSTILYRLFPILLLPISFSFGTCPISIIQIIQNMLECNFCSSPSQDNYIYTECAHLICLPCASMKWDRKYSLRCCNTTTFLEEETCFALEKINQLQERPPKDSSKENIPIHSYATFAERAQPVTIKISKEEPPIKSRQTQHSIYVSEFEPKPLERQQEGFNDRRNEACLAQMESILNEGVQRIKFSFEMYRKELERREEALLKDVYNKFSDQFAKYAVNEEDTKEFKERMNRMIADEMAGLNKISVRELEGKPDKILEKLEYNQLKMKEKLHRHYELLK